MRAALSVLKPAIIGLIASAALMLMNGNNFIDYKSWIIFNVVLVASIKKSRSHIADSAIRCCRTIALPYAGINTEGL